MAAEHCGDFLEVSGSLPRVACCGGFCAQCGVVGRWDGLCENRYVFGLLMVGCSLNNNHISDVGAAKITEALPNSKLTKLS